MSELRIAGAEDAGSAQMIDGIRMATEIVMRPVADLMPYARNTKKHGPKQIAAIAESMREYGFTNPVLIADGGLLAGHGRLLAAEKVGLKRVPTIDLSHLTQEQRRAYVLWDNRSAEIDSGYDLEMLKLETDELRALGIDLEASTGFSEEDLAKLLADMDIEEKGGGCDPDDAPPVPDHPVSLLGDVWCIGDHRVMCGSSLLPGDWGKLMDGELADVCWSDPPYNVDIGGKNDAIAKAQGRKNKTGAILNDSMGDKEFYNFLLAMYQAVFDQMKPGAPIYIAHADSEGINFRTAFRDAGFKLQSVLTWKKNSLVLSRWDYQPISEPIIYGWKPGAAHKWYGGRKQTTFTELGETSPFQRQEDDTWTVAIGDEVFIVSGDARVEVALSSVISEPKPAKSDLHPTMKPVNLVSRQLRNSARPGNIVIDAFGGSGSTAIAAHQCNMKARLMELDPKYVDVIVTRLQMFTGLQAVHAFTGEVFPGAGAVREKPAQDASDDLPPVDDMADMF